ncbi:MAG: site-specific DNA-methyltransferase, partial [Gammaproteobacteria bacterium]|nr:site-specific DNA-methyltransferase [Gammaproteobacteria bacterium]
MSKGKTIKTLNHQGANRKNIPTAEYQSVLQKDVQSDLRIAYERRNADLDPQLVWRGKDMSDWSDLMVQAPPLYIQEKVHPKALIDDLHRVSKSNDEANQKQTDLFADFDGLSDEVEKTEFYQHDANWANRMILGDSLQVMASLAEREGLRGKVQCIYIDPPYGIKFNSNFQWSTTSRDVQDSKLHHITREPEQVKAFRDTWRDGIHSYLTYLRDRLTVARDLLTESGSVFVQIGDGNVHRVRVVMDEVFGEDNFLNLITCRVSSGTTRIRSLKSVSDYLIWYGKNAERTKFRRLLKERELDTGMYNQITEENRNRRRMNKSEQSKSTSLPPNSKAFSTLPLHSKSAGDHEPRECFGSHWRIPPMRSWRYSPVGFQRLKMADRVISGKDALRSIYYHDDYPAAELNDTWNDTGPEVNKTYVVQTSPRIIQRCLLMTTDPGDLVLDPTCGSGTTAFVAEHWGRRWITTDTSRVALALARARIMGAHYPYYLLLDSIKGKVKEAEILGRPNFHSTTCGDDIRHGFVYKRVPHITLKSIAGNAEIDVIWEKYQALLEPLRNKLNVNLTTSWEEWEIPHKSEDSWPLEARDMHKEWQRLRIERQKKIDESISAGADFELLHDQPYEDRKTVRVAGPFTVESLLPHREIGFDDKDEIIDGYDESDTNQLTSDNFVQNILENLK